jgi:hypothetical protein
MNSEDKEVPQSGVICSEENKKEPDSKATVVVESKTSPRCIQNEDGRDKNHITNDTMEIPVTPRKNDKCASSSTAVTPDIENDLLDSPINDMCKLAKRIPKKLGHVKIVAKSSGEKKKIEDKKHSLSDEVEGLESGDECMEGRFSPVDEAKIAKEVKVRRLALSSRGKKNGRILDDDDSSYDAGGKLSPVAKTKDKAASFLHCVAGYNPGGNYEGMNVTRELDMMDVNIQEKMDSISGFMTELRSMHEKSGFTPSLFAILFNMQVSLVKYGISEAITQESLEKDFKKMMTSFDNYDMESFTRFHKSIMYQMFNMVYKSQNNEHTLGGSVFAWDRGGTILKSWLDFNLVEEQGKFQQGEIVRDNHRMNQTWL